VLVLERGVLERGVPEQGVPERDMLERSVLERSVLERGVPERGVPERGVPERGVPERGVLESEECCAHAVLLGVVGGMLQRCWAAGCSALERCCKCRGWGAFVNCCIMHCIMRVRHVHYACPACALCERIIRAHYAFLFCILYAS